jgi:hypothetical protein
MVAEKIEPKKIDIHIHRSKLGCSAAQTGVRRLPTATAQVRAHVR